MFLDGARVVAAALAAPEVRRCWDDASVLDDQRVAGLAGHLARGSVWVVQDYLDAPAPDLQVDTDDAAHYFSSLLDALDPDDHRAVRERGASVAEVGHDALVASLDERLEALRQRLDHEDPSRPVTVAGGKVMRLADYLETRIVEQVVHLDDLARSVGVQRWAMPAGADALVIAVGVEVARRRRGDLVVLRALFRPEAPGAGAAFPALG